MDLSEPRVLFLDLAALNAFTMGGSDGGVVFDASLFGLLDDDRLAGILAHKFTIWRAGTARPRCWRSSFSRP